MSELVRVLKPKFKAPYRRFVQIPYNLLSWLKHLSPVELSCYLEICFVVTGSSKLADEISMEQFIKQTGYARAAVSRAITGLESKKMIRVSRSHRKLNIYEPLDFDFKQWV